MLTVLNLISSKLGTENSRLFRQKKYLVEKSLHLLLIPHL